MRIFDANRRAWVVEACYNVRDLGGHPTQGGMATRPGRLVRADDLFRLRPAGREVLTTAGLCAVVDLRDARELEARPNPFAGGGDGAPAYHHAPLVSTDARPAVDGALTLDEAYEIIVERCRPQVGAALEAIGRAAAGGLVLFHCFAGKDRTGIVAGLILAACGVPHDAIAADYAASDEGLQPVYVQIREALAAAPERLRRYEPMLTSPPEVMERLLAGLVRRHGSIEDYLAGAGVSDAALDGLRSSLTSG